MKCNAGTIGLLAAVAAVALFASAPALAREVDETVKADKDGLVTVENIAGSIRIEGWDKAEVKVTGTLGEDVEDLEIKAGGRRTLVKVVYPRKARNLDDGADLVLMVPRQSSLEVECVSAPITIEGVAGGIEATDVSGEIRIEGGSGEVAAETISGALTVRTAAGKVSAHSISGRVEVSGDEAEVEAQTVSGDVLLSFKTFRGFSVESVSGTAEVSGALAKDGRFDFDLLDGDVILTVPADASADFHVETFSGEIENAFGQPAERTSKLVPGRNLEFSVGGGEARVKINTFSGDVEIRKR